MSDPQTAPAPAARDWYFAFYEDAERWSGPHDSRDTALATARREDPEARTVHLLRGKPMALIFHGLFDGHDDDDLAPGEYRVDFDGLAEAFEELNLEAWDEDGSEWSLAVTESDELVEAIEAAQGQTEGRAEAMSAAFEEWCRNNPARLPKAYMLDTYAHETYTLPEGYATLADLQAWAADIMARAPDFKIYTRQGTDYLRRWWVIPRSEFCNAYLHEIVASDDDRALHDHPWDSTSMILEGSYIEHTPEGSFTRLAGDVVSRKATDAHRLEIPEGGRCISLFITGPKVREWGFHCPKGWVLWSDFVDDANTGKIGKGCEG